MAGVGIAEDTRVAAPTIVRIAIYDSMTAAPRIEEVYGDSPLELIERISARVYQIARDAGGSIAYTVIRELTENLAHARFEGVVVSVLNGGSVIRFTDAGPGIADVGRALRPGFSTATLEMRAWIRGVDSGLPIVAECMSFAGGGLDIDRNLGGGAAVTVFAAAPEQNPPTDPSHARASSPAVSVADEARGPGSACSDDRRAAREGLVRRPAGPRRVRRPGASRGGAGVGRCLGLHPRCAGFPTARSRRWWPSWK